MTSQQNEKLNDYLSGINDLDTKINLPIGGVIFDSKDKTDIIKLIEKANLDLIETANLHEDQVLKQLIDVLQNKKTAVLNVNAQLSGKILNQLNNIKDKQVNVILAGETEPLVINPLPDGAKLILLLTNEQYDNHDLQTIISSYCRL